MKKALYFRLYQAFAHYREPKVLQDDYISTLELPSMTTVAGMLSYILDEKFEKEIDMAIIGTHKSKEIHFIRGENGDFWKKYRGLVKNKKDIDMLRQGEFYNFYKGKQAENRIMNFEVLRDVSLDIFINTDIEVLEKLKDKLENNNKYLTLGRKEDFALLGYLDEERVKRFDPIIVDVEEVEVHGVRDSLEKDILLKNTYVKLDSKNSDNDKLLNSGVLYTLPYAYEDLAGNKVDRRLKYNYYMYLEGDFYPNEGIVSKYENKNFYWMGGEE